MLVFVDFVLLMSETFCNYAKTNDMEKLRNFYENNKDVSILYIIWFTLNFIALFISDASASHIFYPFGKADTRNVFDGHKSDSVYHAYDFSEFIVYTIVPIILYFLYVELNKKQ